MRSLSQISRLKHAHRWWWVVAIFLFLFSIGSAVAPHLLHAQTISDSTEAVNEEQVETAESTDIDSQAESSSIPGYEIGISLDRVRELVNLGTVELAYRLIAEARPEYDQTSDWIEWETLHLELAWQLEAWNDLIDRATQLKETEISHLAQTYAIRAEIHQKQYSNALRNIRALILDQSGDQNTLIQLRRLIAQLYVEEENLEDAEIALALYDRDYRPSAPEWEHRYTRVLFRNNKLDEAQIRLSPLQTLEAQLLNLYARFQTRASSPSETVLKGLEIQPQFESDPELHAELWALIEVAARAYNDFEMQTEAIESGLSIDYTQLSKWVHLPVVPLNTENQLLETYDQFAFYVGNDIGLVIGDDESWFQLAQEFEITSPITARAVHAYLARNAYDSEYKERSTRALANLLYEAGLQTLLDRLFVRKNLLDVSKVSHELQTRLANALLKQKDYEKALSIINVMATPEAPAQLESWYLTQARIAISIGEYDRSRLLLDEAISHLPLPAEQSAIDRIKQVVYDLQDRNQHDLAIQFFVKLYDKATETQDRRELLRWISESYSAMEDYVNASEHLLRSAQLGNDWNDEWGIAARLKAGDEMLNAGFISDARVIYTQLHDDALDPRTRALISNRLHGLPVSDSVSSQR